jgi:hypothetical protein
MYSTIRGRRQIQSKKPYRLWYNGYRRGGQRFPLAWFCRRPTRRQRHPWPTLPSADYPVSKILPHNLFAFLRHCPAIENLYCMDHIDKKSNRNSTAGGNNESKRVCMSRNVLLPLPVRLEEWLSSNRLIDLPSNISRVTIIESREFCFLLLNF